MELAIMDNVIVMKLGKEKIVHNQNNAQITVVIMELVIMDNVIVMKLGKEKIVHNQNNALMTVVIMELVIMDNVIVMKVGKEKIVLKKKVHNALLKINILHTVNLGFNQDIVR
jgi:hypothetical protein